MNTLIITAVVVGLSVGIAEALGEKPVPSPPNTIMVPPESDVRLAKVKGATQEKVGLLAYYPNEGGGYTFVKGKTILFYALPYEPAIYTFTHKLPAGTMTTQHRTIGTSRMPLGGETIYRCEMFDLGFGACRRDIPIAKWSRTKGAGRFQLRVLGDDYEMTLHLKSIVPVLEHAEHGR